MQRRAQEVIECCANITIGFSVRAKYQNAVRQRAKNRSLSLSQNDYLALMSAGAYGFTMSSNYNSRPRAAEVMVSATNHQLIRERETVADLFTKERLYEQ